MWQPQQPLPLERSEVLAFLADLGRYHDRYLMLRAAAREVGHLHLFTTELPPGRSAAELGGERLTVRRLGGTGPRLRRPLAQLWMLRQGLALQRTRPVRLLHDTHAFLLPLMLQAHLHRGPRPVLLTSLFTGNHDWYDVVRHRWPYRGALALNRYYWRVHFEEALLARVTDAVTLFGEGHRAPFARLHRLPLERVHSLPNCADPARFHPVPPAPLPRGLAPGPGLRVLLYSGKIYEHKGLFELVHAFARIVPRHPGARLVLAGGGHQQDVAALRRSIDGLNLGQGRVLLAGEVPREALPGLLCACEAFVFPSYNEGSPRSVIEAMACARPVVATRLPGIQALDPQAQSIYFVERGDTGDLAAALDRLLAAPPEELHRRGALARERFVAHHTPEAASRELVALYRHLTGSP